MTDGPAAELQHDVLAEMIEHHGTGPDLADRIGDALAGDVGGGAVHRLEHGGELAGGVDVPAGGQSDAAADRGGEVGEDVAEQVVGDDHVEAARVVDQVDGGGIDVGVVHTVDIAY